MSLHERLADLLWRGLEPRLTERLARRAADHVWRDELVALSAEIARMTERVANLEERLVAAERTASDDPVAALARKVGMASAAVQAVEGRVGGIGERAARAEALAAQALQQATSARATAESVADGIEALEHDKEA